ncbi:MAG: hypothetical protein MUF34_08610 [Polyangiaceae bacterium]|jgi:hypothetical protein|nr:hypothetical protein [Polyangiaceae bacterium]
MSSLRPLVALALGAALWLPQVHRCFTPSLAARAALAGQVGEPQLRQLALAPGARELAALGATNPEWELLGRGFLALGLADLALASPGLAARHVAALDQLVDETLADERAGGPRRFLLPYAQRGPLERSLFVDGQVALMLAARLHVAPRPELRARLEERVRLLEAALDRPAPRLAESYPGECWTYDHTGALAALRLWDALSGDDHRPLAARWLAMARERLVDRETGLLVSSFRPDGRALEGPEGSTLWVSAYNLLLVDEAFAREQYEKGRRVFRREVLGFVTAREWPAGVSRPDIDSGPVVPWLEASPGSSGLLLVAAAAFDDRPTLEGLLASLELAAFPIESEGGRRYAAAGSIGNSALVRALGFGPLWRRAASAPAGKVG